MLLNSHKIRQKCCTGGSKKTKGTSVKRSTGGSSTKIIKTSSTKKRGGRW